MPICTSPPAIKPVGPFKSCHRCPGMRRCLGMSTKLKRYLLLGIHWIIILNFLVEILYTAYMIFVVLQPESGGGPLMERAKTMAMDPFMKRRLYAIECWIAIGGLAIYLGLTEIGPRLRAQRTSEAAE